MNKSNATWIIIVGLLALGALCVLLVIGALALSDGGGFSLGGDRIAVIPVEGVIDSAMAKKVKDRKSVV